MSMNEHGSFDFKRPIGVQNDYRTSTYRGHRKLPDEVSGFIRHDFLQGQNQNLQNIGNVESCLTESQEQFAWKILKPSVVRKPIRNGINFIKSFDETHLRNYPKLKPHLSAFSQREYQWKTKSLEEHPPIIDLSSKIGANTNISNERCTLGFGKFLDPSATTNNLAYRAYSKEETGITPKSIITFYNWKNTFHKKHSYCNVAKKPSPPHTTFQNSVKHVPNNGFISEARSNYKQHLNFTNFDLSHINNKLINCTGVPNKYKSENTIYGSGVRIQNYLA